MSTITTRIKVSEDGRISSAVPLPVGSHHVRVEISDQPPVHQWAEPFDIDKLPKVDLGPWPWPAGTTFSREEIYGDDGR